MSAAFKGAQAGLGTELWRGATAYYTELNARGGVNGRRLSVSALDDDYQPDPCVRNTIQLLEQDPAFFLSNYVGTPTLTRALPIIKRYGDAILIGNFTGAQPQREQPYVDFVFNIRASYRQEMAALVERFWTLGARKFGVYYQIDAYGRSGTDSVERALAQRGTRMVSEATYVRGAKRTPAPMTSTSKINAGNRCARWNRSTLKKITIASPAEIQLPREIVTTIPAISIKAA